MKGDAIDESSNVGEVTYLIVYELDGDSIGKVRVGNVPGYALNQFSMDHEWDETTDTDYFRIATCE